MRILLIISVFCFFQSETFAQHTLTKVRHDSTLIRAQQALILSKVQYSAPLTECPNQLLYKTEINFGKNFFSGLMVFKKDTLKKEYNIICLSEVGLNIMEYKYVNNKIILVKHLTMFNNKIVFRLMKKYLMLLIQNVENNKIKGKILDSGMLIKTKFPKNSGVRGRSFYLYDDKGVVKKIYTSGLLPLKFEIKSYNGNVPENIFFSQRFLNLSISLRLLK